MAYIVAIDDEPEWLSLHEQIFTDNGHRVSTFADGKEALSGMGWRQPDLIIVDLRMRTSGRHVIKTVRRMWPDVRIVVHTAYDGYRDDPEISTKCAAFVLKSGDYSQLLAVAERILADASAAVE
jgi:DNA-binding NtrC family response regulator